VGLCGDAARARDLVAELASDREHVFGPEHSETLVDRSGLAYWTGEAGDAPEAVRLFEALLPIRERAMGAADLEGAKHRGRLADLRTR
jgi:hypothetical protein